MRLHAAALALLALLAAGAVAAAADPPIAASACPSLLTLLGAFPNSTVFADILQALGGTAQPVTSEPPLPTPGGVNGPGTAAAVRRRLAQTPTATTGAKPMACPAIYAPVCGIDNKTYGNECSALSLGAQVACKGECPCPGTSGGSLGGVCIDIVEPVCGTDRRNYTNSCFAQVAGVQVSCMSTCPCPDLITELQLGGGGLLLVPTDEALLAELDALNVTGVGEDDTAALKQLLARHVVLTDHQKGLSGKQPLPSATGTPAVTEAGQRLTLYAGADGAPGRVQTGGPEVLDTYGILAQTSGCLVTALQIDGALGGLPAKAAR